ncbi:hypothetical protein [Butyrivibrio sp.]|uniref:hypothetical protein n=1 Tax=Butyrivibrio sp. TaxID=28121 RepID=UPI0025BE1F32|nr:hypothetical protein [Butyrivibrio sp.]MBQ7431343.1 hypothetical protein [Butyrivibrio sp.]MBQ9302716.1 hypothetical protein [Butyrivibrio sp.]
MDLFGIILEKSSHIISKEQIAQMLNTTPEALAKFEKVYNIVSDEENRASGNFFKLNSRDVAKHMKISSDDIAALESRIVNELLASSGLISCKDEPLVTKEEILNLPEEFRPQLTGNLIKKDITQDSYPKLLFDYAKWRETEDIHWYHMFRQGLDILDLDPVTYEIIGMNPNSMGYWFPALKNAADLQDFFKIPETKIVKVPLPILQLTKLDYFSLTPTTLNIVDAWARKAFELDENKTYFIKTGTYSSKFDFRNAKVTSSKEVQEIGQYLLFIHAQAIAMAHYDLSGRNQPCIYGVSTTNEWVVREYIEDKENLPCIYHGMPLHTEYRAFIDFDTNELLGIVPYWDAESMKKRFSQEDDADTADMKHDYIIYCKEEERLQKTFDENIGKISDHLKSLIPDIDLKGQWSLDIMQNGEDFWLIDMALAANSALVNKLPIKLEAPAENWLPDFQNTYINRKSIT